MERGCFGTSIGHADLDQDIVRAFFGVFHEDIKVTVIIEDPCVQQLILKLIAAPATAGFYENLGRKSCLGIFVEILHVGVGGSAVQVEIVLLHVLTVVSLAVGHAEETFFQDRIFAVPKRERKAEPLFVVRNAAQTVFAPA